MSALATPVTHPGSICKPAEPLRFQVANFFLTDLQAGLGPLSLPISPVSGGRLAPGGRAPSFGGIMTALLQTPARCIVDRAWRKRLTLLAGTLVIALGAILLARNGHLTKVYAPQTPIRLAASFLGPGITAIILGVTDLRFSFSLRQCKNASAIGELLARGSATTAAPISISPREPRPPRRSRSRRQQQLWGTLMERSGYYASFLALRFITELAFSLLLLAIRDPDPLTSKENA